MSEPRIGRVLVASLHQAIADLLPTRLEFYENWLNVSGLRDGTIGLAPLSAVLSFLRTEGEAYALITARAGEYAAEWTVNSLPTFERRVIRALPAPLRLRAALRVARGAGALDVSRLARDRQGAAGHRVASTCAARCSAKCAKPPCCRCAGSTRRPSRACCTCSALPADARVAECRAPGARKGCMMSSPSRPRRRRSRQPRDRDAPTAAVARRGSVLVTAARAGGGDACRPPRSRILVVPFDNASRGAAPALARRGVGGAADRRTERARPARDHPRRARARLRAAAPAALRDPEPRDGDQDRRDRRRIRSDRRQLQRVGRPTCRWRSTRIRIDVGRLEPEVQRARAAGELFTRLRTGRGTPRTGFDARTPARASRGRRSMRSRTTSRGCVADSPAAQATFLETAIRQHPGYDRAQLALWDVRTEQGDDAAALAAARAVPRGLARCRAARAFSPAVSLLELEALRRGVRRVHGARRRRRGAPPGTKPDAAVVQQPGHRAAASRRDGRADRHRALLPDEGR